MDIFERNHFNKPKLQPSKPKNLTSQEPAITITIFYGILGTFWILLSDKILLLFLDDKNTLNKLQTLKGLTYILMTSALLYFLVNKQFKQMEKVNLRIEKSYAQLSKTYMELTKAKEELNSLAFNDKITGLPNKYFVEKEISYAITNLPSNEVVLIYMDIDNFRNINDTLGHSAGDQLLKYMAEMLQSLIKAPNTIARVSGDEFLVICYENSDKEFIINMVEKVVNKLRDPWYYKGTEFFVSLSIGIVNYPHHGKDFETLLKNADSAMYLAKDRGKDRYVFFTDDMQQKRLEKLDLANCLNYAIEKNEFLLHYQPQFDMKTNNITGVEALLRWNHPNKGLIPPALFIPLAEETGQIHNINKWVLKMACLQKKKWEQKGCPHIMMSVNFSCKGFDIENIVEEIKTILDETQTNYSEVQLEITETTFIQNIERATEVISELRKLGLNIALDDFGTGYSSLTYLKTLPINTVKIDRGFIQIIDEKVESEVIVNAVIQLAYALNLKVVAEGVETEIQLEILKNSGCEEGQGYLFSKPVTPETMESMMLKVV